MEILSCNGTTGDIIPSYDLLPNATNLRLWRYTNSDLCLSCKIDRDTLRHVLSACPHSLQMYTWWHNKVLEVIIELLRAQCETANQQSITAKEPIIQFLNSICIKLDLVESEKVFSMKEIHAEPPFPYDYIRNGYCKRVITSTAEIKCFFFFFLITNCTLKMKIKVNVLWGKKKS